MCIDPVTAGLVVGAVGVGIQSIGAYRGAQAQNQALEYNAQVADYNASVAEQQAEQAGERGRRAVKDLRTEGRRLAAQQRVGFAGSGVDIGAGSPADVLADTARGVELDALDLEYNTALEQYGFGAQAGGFRNQSRLNRSAKRSALDAGGLTLLSGGLSLGSQYFMNRPRAFRTRTRTKPRDVSAFTNAISGSGLGI